ncbi:hypothetical protein RAS1_13660 [Phycisphaerae bacterium RAS1]|nr:hypothetical protein RAS1_13660 [Phycisphaerae bacterium RAS1]
MSSGKQTHAIGQLYFGWSESRPTDGDPPQENSNLSAPSGCSYGPGHPWHYLLQGDNAQPVAFDDIPASEESTRAMAQELPMPRVKRIIAVREQLESERRELDAARVRYQEIIDRGTAALSRYDREIAYGGNDEMARAGTLALLFQQAAWRKGRIACLERERSGGLSRTK